MVWRDISAVQAAIVERSSARKVELDLEYKERKAAAAAERNSAASTVDAPSNPATTDDVDSVLTYEDFSHWLITVHPEHGSMARIILRKDARGTGRCR